MDWAKAKNKSRRKLNVGMNEAKHIAENLLQINEKRFRLKSVISDRIRGFINGINYWKQLIIIIDILIQ